MRGLARRAKVDGPQTGQAIVEFVLMTLLILVAVGIMAQGFRRSLFKLWGMMSREVAAACPGCPADENLRLGR
jgi:hypothetical protein